MIIIYEIRYTDSLEYINDVTLLTSYWTRNRELFPNGCTPGHALVNRLTTNT